MKSTSFGSLAAISARLVICLGTLGSVPGASAGPVQERNIDDVYVGGTFSNADLMAAFEQASVEAMTGDLFLGGAGQHLARRSRESHDHRIRKRAKVAEVGDQADVKAETDASEVEVEVDVSHDKRQVDALVNYARMRLKNIAWAAGTSIFEGGCWIATRLFNLNEWGERGCYIGVSLTSLVSAWTIGGFNPTGLDNLRSGRLRDIRNFFQEVTRRDLGERGATTRADLVSMLVDYIDDEDIKLHADDLMGLLDPVTGSQLSYGTWLTAAVQPLLVSTDLSNETALIWLDFADDHLNINNWVPVPYSPNPATANASSSNTSDASMEFEKRNCVEKGRWCAYSGCEQSPAHSWTVCGSGWVGGPSGHYFYQDFYGDVNDYNTLVAEMGQQAGDNIPITVEAKADKQMSQNAWHTCVCYLIGDRWVSTGSSQFTWDGGAYNGHDQCWEANCGTGY